MKKNIKVSVITVTYNAEHVLETTIESILGQDYDPVEYLIIDGGSTDGTVNIIKKYQSRIAYWVSEPDGGLYDAMNKGLSRATGDYVWFINAGDRLTSSGIVTEIFAGLQGEILPDIIYGETGIWDEKGKRIGGRRLKAPEHLTWDSFKWGMLVCHQSFIAKRAIAPFYNLQYRLAADYDWCIRCLKQSVLIVNSRRELSGFLEGGISGKYRKKGLKERFRIMCKYYGYGGTLARHIWFVCRFYFTKWFVGRV